LLTEQQQSDIIMRWKVAVTHDGEVEIYSLFEEGGPLIKCRNDGVFSLFEVPQYGGDPQFYGDFDSLLDAIKTGETFT
jgi:hypothetical protein